MIKWIPIAEKMPPPNIDVLVYDEELDILVCRYIKIDADVTYWAIICNCWDGRCNNVTHWAELPEGPEIHPKFKTVTMYKGLYLASDGTYWENSAWCSDKPSSGLESKLIEIETKEVEVPNAE